MITDLHLSLSCANVSRVNGQIASTATFADLNGATNKAESEPIEMILNLETNNMNITLLFKI